MALFDQSLQEGEDEVKKASQWGDIINTPAGQAALLQFGISMLQPGGFGASFPGAVGRAIGEGGEAAARVKKQSMAEEEQASKLEDQRLARSLEQERLGQAERRTAAYERAVDQKGGKGALSATALFGAAQRKQRAWGQFLINVKKARLEQAFTPEATALVEKDFGDPVYLATLRKQWDAQENAGPAPGVGAGEGNPATADDDLSTMSAEDLYELAK